MTATSVPLLPQGLGHKRLYLWLLLYCAIAYFPLFLHLDAPAINTWDEALFTIRAYHLANEGSFLQNFDVYTAGCDNVNIKPPFGTYFQAAAFGLFGYTELAVRLPVALFCLATGMLLIVFFHRYFNNALLGFFAALVLVCTPGYTYQHVSRTGDHDGILAFLVLAASLCFFLFVESGKTKWIVATAILFAFGFLTKTFVALLALPAFAIYVVYRGRLREMLADKRIWLSLLLFLSIAGAQYAIVYLTAPDYFSSLSLDEGHKRFVSVVHQHQGSFWMFFYDLANWKFMPWLLLFPLSIALAFTKRFAPYRNIMVFLILASLSHLLVVSVAQTKLPWYEAATYPWLASIAGFGIWAIWTGLSTYLQPNRTGQAVILGVFVVSLFGIAYIKEVKENFNPILYTEQQRTGSLLKNIRDHQKHLRSFTIFEAFTYNIVTSFYVESMNKHKGFDLKWNGLRDYSNIAVGDTIAFCSNEITHDIECRYLFNTIYWTGGCHVVVIDGICPDNDTVQHTFMGHISPQNGSGI